MHCRTRQDGSGGRKTRPSVAPLAAKLSGALIVALSLIGLWGSPVASATGGSVTPDPSPQPAGASATSSPTPDPAPQAASSFHSSGPSTSQPVASSPAPAPPQTPAPTVVPAPAGPAIGVSQSAAAASRQAAPVAPLTRVPLAHHTRPHPAPHARRREATRTIPGPTAVPVPWHGADPLDVQSALTLPTVLTPHRDGVLLLVGAGALALLVLASASMLRVLVRMDGELGV
jgi:hypothetical protein